jgi:hypothetical protein
MAQAGCLRHVFEPSVSFVSIEAMLRGRGNPGVGYRSTIHEEEIEPAVGIEVEKEPEPMVSAMCF